MNSLSFARLAKRIEWTTGSLLGAHREIGVLRDTQASEQMRLDAGAVVSSGLKAFNTSHLSLWLLRTCAQGRNERERHVAILIPVQGTAYRTVLQTGSGAHHQALDAF